MEQETRPLPARKRSNLPLFLGAAVLLFTATGAFLWMLSNRVQALQLRLSGMEQRATSVEHDVIQKSREVDSLQGQLIATRERALQAENQADELEARNRASESQVQQLRQESETSAAAAELAVKQKQQALVSQQEAVGELERMRQQRAAELDRMQQALSRIAPTVRTPSGMVMQLANASFKFDFDSAAIRPENRETLSRIAGVLLASEGYRLFIDGDTDDIGTDAYNQGLSERRASSVRDYLVKAGVPADIISVRGFGKSNPLVQAKTREAREKNRRVEIGIVDTIISYPTAGAASNH